jgi:cysteine synthase
MDLAESLAQQISGGFYVNQFGNPANPAAHERTTGPEIWEQMGGDIDAIVAGIGSGGTITGGRAAITCRKNPDVQVFWPTRSAPSWPGSSRRASPGQREATRWRASARTSCRQCGSQL